MLEANDVNRGYLKLDLYKVAFRGHGQEPDAMLVGVVLSMPIACEGGWYDNQARKKAKDGQGCILRLVNVDVITYRK